MPDSDAFIAAMNRLQAQRQTGQAKIGMAFGSATILLRFATRWAEQDVRDLALWRAGGLAGAMSALGEALECRPEPRALALMEVTNAATGTSAIWDALPTERRVTLLEAACTAGSRRDVFARLDRKSVV